MITEKEISKMKKGSYLINSCRGDVVDVNALAAALKSGHLQGAAVDVHSYEPAKNGNNWKSPLQKLPNVILTPHIGGSTEEAQKKIGITTAQAMIAYMNSGISLGAVNFPNLNPQKYDKHHRLLHIHENKPGCLKVSKNNN